MAFSADSKTLYSSGWDGAVRRWDVLAQKQLALPMGVRATAAVAAAPNGQSLAYADDSGSIRLVDTEQGTELHTIELPGVKFSEVTFAPGSQYLAAGGTNGDQVTVAVLDLESRNVICRWDWPRGRDPHSGVESLAFAPDGSRLAAAVFRQDTAYLWDLTTGRKIAQLPHAEVYGLSFSPDGETLATAGWDKIVRFWATDTGAARREVKVTDKLGNDGDLRMYTVCYAPTGGLVATAHLDGAVCIWDWPDMTFRKRFSVKGRFIFGSVRFSPDGLWLATGSMSGDITLWDPLTGESVRDVGRHQSYVYTVGFGRDSRTLVSGGNDGVCYLWDLQPRGQHPEESLDLLWRDLGAGDGPAAYRAMWSMAKTPDRTVAFVGEKLRPVRSVMDLDRLGTELSDGELARRQRLSRLLANKDETVELLVRVRRAISLLGELSTPDAIGLLKELADRQPNEELGRSAAAAAER